MSLQQEIKMIIKQEIFEIIGDAISIQDTDFKIVYQNNAGKKFAGNNIGKLCYKAFLNSDAICKSCPLDLTFKDGKARTIEKSIPLDDFSLTAEITTSAIKNSEGNIIAGIEVIKDITEHRQMIEERERLIFELQNALAKHSIQ